MWSDLLEQLCKETQISTCKQATQRSVGSLKKKKKLLRETFGQRQTKYQILCKVTPMQHWATISSVMNSVSVMNYLNLSRFA